MAHQLPPHPYPSVSRQPSQANPQPPHPTSSISRHPSLHISPVGAVGRRSCRPPLSLFPHPTSRITRECAASTHDWLRTSKSTDESNQQRELKDLSILLHLRESTTSVPNVVSRLPRRHPICIVRVKRYRLFRRAPSSVGWSVGWRFPLFRPHRAALTTRVGLELARFGVVAVGREFATMTRRILLENVASLRAIGSSSEFQP